MENKHCWEESKFTYHRGKLVSSRNTKHVGIASRLITDIIASFYDTYIPLHVKGKLLDLGCGKVPLYQAYRNYIDDNICIDWGKSLHKNSHLDIEHDLSKPLPIANDTFHTIILSDVLEHIPEPQNLWNEISRILKPNGKIILNVPFYYWLHENPYDYYRYTEHALRRFANSTGLKIIVLQPIGGVPEIISDILSKNLCQIPIVGNTLANFLQVTSHIFIKTRLGKKISQKTSQNFPLGYFLIAEKK